MRLHLLGIIVLYLLSGCGTGEKISKWFEGNVDNTEPPTPLTSFNTQLDIIEAWKKDTGKGSDNQFLKLSPVVAHEKIFVADTDGSIKAIDAISGNVLWDIKTDTRITGGPGAGLTLVLAGTSEGEVLAISIDDGTILWRGRTSSEILAPPQEASNIVVARSIDGKIYGLSATDGKRLWVYDRTVPNLTLRGTSAPVIEDNLVIAGFDGGRMAAIELQTGKQVWETRIALGSGRSELDRMVDIDADPLILDGVIYVATFQGRVAAVELESGRILWTRDISSYAGLTADDEKLYVTDDKGHIWALDRITGSSIWKQEKLQARSVTAPASISDLIVVGDLEGYLHWLDKADGKFVARNKLSGSKILAPPISVNDVIYAYSSDGVLGAYNIKPAQIIPEQPEELVADSDKTQAQIKDESVKTQEAEEEVCGEYFCWTVGNEEPAEEDTELTD